MTRPLIHTLTAAALIGAAYVPAFAQAPEVTGGTVTSTAPGKGTVTNVVKITASVEAVNAANRTLTLKGRRGNIITLPVGPDVKNFAQIKVGDLVVVRYVEALTLELKKGGTAVRERVERDANASAQPGARPAAGLAREVTIVADVIAVDSKKQVVTLRGPSRVVDLKIRYPNQLKLVKVGDQVEATYTEAMAVSVRAMVCARP